MTVTVSWASSKWNFIFNLYFQFVSVHFPNRLHGERDVKKQIPTIGSHTATCSDCSSRVPPPSCCTKKGPPKTGFLPLGKHAPHSLYVLSHACVWSEKNKDLVHTTLWCENRYFWCKNVFWVKVMHASASASNHSNISTPAALIVWIIFVRPVSCENNHRDKVPRRNKQVNLKRKRSRRRRRRSIQRYYHHDWTVPWPRALFNTARALFRWPKRAPARDGHWSAKSHRGGHVVRSCIVVAQGLQRDRPVEHSSKPLEREQMGQKTLWGVNTKIVICEMSDKNGRCE